MKRSLTILLVFALLFSAAACTNINDRPVPTTVPSTTTTTAPPPVVKENKQSREFKNSDGEVVYIIDVVLPEISENCEKKILDFVNKVTNEYFEDACTDTEKNIESASAFAQLAGSPQKKTIFFETTYLSSRFVCFLIGETVSFVGSESNDANYSTLCFDIEKGRSCTVDYFAEDISLKEEATDFAVAYIQKKAPYDFYPSGMGLIPAQIDKIKTAFDLESFYITEEGMGFYFSRNVIDTTLSGAYRHVIPWSELDGYFIAPDKIQ